MYKDFDITKTKLIIWDLDDTFWDGTLSEGGVSFNNENLKLVEELTNYGLAGKSAQGNRCDEFLAGRSNDDLYLSTFLDESTDDKACLVGCDTSCDT